MYDVFAAKGKKLQLDRVCTLMCLSSLVVKGQSIFVFRLSEFVFQSKALY